jgi:cell division protein FtsA
MKKKNKTIFALDIGTRSIVGLLLEENKQDIIIKNIVVKEHSNRAMLDGQIHNIPQVSLLVKEVKKELEENTGTKLKKVAVAAAGRSLKTVKTSISIKLDNEIPVKHEDVLNLELKGAQKSQAILLENQKTDDKNQYYCVGYSITKYFLDDSEIGSLIGQKGKTAGLEIVSAFLPKVVVDSLQAVLTENGLELSNITLEPIAAINAILPPTMRKLNLALVDIGAGTSDIAVSYDGSIIGYGMVPVAGDEITEALCEHFLLDFNEGEELKRKLNINLEKELTFTDILGIEHSLKGLEIVKNFSNIIEILAQKIANEITVLNNKSPQAVILIGGGSLTPLLAQYLADFLGLPKERVAVQKASAIKEVLNLPEDFQGPEIITPIGIGLTALKNLSLGFIPVQVNNFNINLLNLGKNTVLDALLAAGIDTGKVFGKPGLALTVEVNGKIKTFPGSLGEKALVKVNGKVKTLDTLLQPRDKIEYIPAKDGKPGRGFVKDILPKSNTIKLNDKTKELPYEVTIDGKCVTLETELKDGDKIYIREINQIGELLELWKIVDVNDMLKFTLVVNGDNKSVAYFPFEITRNEKPLNLFDTVNPGDQIYLNLRETKNFTVEQILKNNHIIDHTTEITVTVNGQDVKIPVIDLEININGKKAKMTDNIKSGDIVTIDFHKNKTPILIDIFPRINFSTTPPPGKVGLDMYINEKEAEYTSMLKDGDIIKLIWR